MKRLKITRERRRRRPKELAGLHGIVFQVAFGLLLAFYNREKSIQSFDIPLLQLRNERCPGEAVLISILAFSRHNF